MSISTAQIRGARGILNWSQQDLSERTGISTTSIGAIEKGATQPRESNLQLIQKAFENAGIEFFENDGVRRRADEIRIFVGRNGYLDFFEDVYKTLEDNPESEVFVNNVDERRFIKAHGDQAEYHLSRMSKLKEIRYKVLLREGDNFFAVTQYAEYKWLPKTLFATVPFYSYGSKLGIILLDTEPKIIVINHPAVSEAYRMQFLSIWEHALTPDVDTIKTYHSGTNG
ncbi:MAG: helix-turn-helix domain-containing protein [Pseudobdellovibrionaceae bacterium]